MSILELPELEETRSEGVGAPRIPLRLLMAAPLGYAIAAVILGDDVEGSLPVFFGLIALKVMTAFSLVVLLGRLGSRLAARPQRVLSTTGVWSAVGLVFLAISTQAIDWITQFGCRVWPGSSHTPTGVDAFATPRYTETTVIAMEAIAIVLIAGATALAASFGRSHSTAARGITAAFATLFAVLAYDAVLAPWSAVWDFDFFTGDIVLGAIQYELVVMPMPWGDPLSAIALAVSAITTASLVAYWQPSSLEAPATNNVD